MQSKALTAVARLHIKNSTSRTYRGVHDAARRCRNKITVKSPRRSPIFQYKIMYGGLTVIDINRTEHGGFEKETDIFGFDH